MRNRTYIFLLLLITGVACKKQLSNGDADFDVQLSASTFSVGDTARFTFAGNPDIITFYSGETGHQYAYKGRTQADGTPVINFKTVRANGNQPNSLLLMVSTDFKGVAKGDTATTKTNIQAASWTDITARATLSTGSTTAVSSGDIDLGDYATAGKPVFIAFKYSGQAGSAQSKWTITNFLVKNTLADGVAYEIANMNTSTTPYTIYGATTYSPGFAAYTLQNNYLWSVSTTQMVITGATSAAAAAAAEAWLFIGPIDLKKVTPDTGVPIKTPSQQTSELKFSYQYAKPGTYNATFVGGRVSIDESALTQKNISITVQ